MINVEQDYRAHMTRDMYSRVNNLRGNYRNKEKFLRHDNGSLIITNDGTIQKVFFQKFFAYSIPIVPALFTLLLSCCRS